MHLAPNACYLTLGEHYEREKSDPQEVLLPEKQDLFWLFPKILGNRQVAQLQF